MSEFHSFVTHDSTHFSSATSAVSSICNVDERDATTREGSSDLEIQKKQTSITTAASKSAPKTEITQMFRNDDDQSKPSYFEVTADVNVTNGGKI